MSTNSQNNDNQEIDLSQISKKIGGFFENLSTKLIKLILFVKKNIVVIGLLFIFGAIVGYVFDKKIKNYNNQIIVTPNFNTTDYLYSKIELINAKIKEGDTLFLKNEVGIKEAKKLSKISIEPITDVYKFINDSDRNFEFLKLLAEDGDIKKIVDENLTSKNYPYHIINFSTSKITSNEKTVKPILDYLNNSDYYKKNQAEYLNNIKIKIKENDSIISQINGVLNSFSNAVNGSQRNEKLIYYNENTQLNEVIKTKNLLIEEQGIHRIDLLNLDRIIKDNSYTINVKNEKSFNGKLKIILPFLFVFLFLIFRFFKSYYKNQLEKINP
jgi:hypothetical protein